MQKKAYYIMKNKKKMFVLFESLEEFHLSKDVGELPKYLAMNLDWDVSILSVLPVFKVMSLEKYVQLKFFNDSMSKKINKIHMFMFVLLKSKELDYLMAFHGSLQKSILFFLCKIINPKLVTYIKLDNSELNAYQKLSQVKYQNRLKYLIYKFFTKYVDVFTVETKKVYFLLSDVELFKNKLYYLPNGFGVDKAYDFSVQKEKLIITVGRIGSSQKNNELFLAAIERLSNIGEYKFVFIGPIENSFITKVEKVIKNDPELSKKIILTGNITNKNLLYGYYKRAEVLCFTSVYESFGLVMVEGAYFGCYLLSSDLGAVYDITNNGKNGTIVEINDIFNNYILDKYFQKLYLYNINELVKEQSIHPSYSKWFDMSVKKFSKELQLIIDGKIDTKDLSRQSSLNVYEKFNWNIIVNDLSTILKKASDKVNNL